MKTPRTAPSRFLTMTFFVYIRLAVNVKHTVTVASSPSGTCVARRRRDATATLSRGGCIDAIAATAQCGPKWLELEKETTLVDVRWSRGRRETHVRHDDADHEDEGRDRVLAHAERRREERDAQSKGDGRDDLDEVVDLLVDGSLFGFRAQGELGDLACVARTPSRHRLRSFTRRVGSRVIMTTTSSSRSLKTLSHGP